LTNYKTVLPIGIFIALLCLIDFTVRLMPNADLIKANSSDNEFVNSSITVLSDAQRKKIDDLLALFDVEAVQKNTSKTVSKVVKPTISLMSKEEQLRQEGELVDLFDGEDKYSLVATFFDGDKRFGVFTKTHLPTGKKSHFRLYENEKVSIYKLTRVSNEFVEFSNGLRKVQMHLFLIKKN